MLLLITAKPCSCRWTTPVVNQLLRPKRVKYDARNFTWLGSSNQTNQVMIIRSDTGVKSWKDLRGRNTIAAAAGTAGFDFVAMNLYRALLKFNLKIVVGYKGSTATTFAVGTGRSGKPTATTGSPILPRCRSGSRATNRLPAQSFSSAYSAIRICRKTCRSCRTW